MGTNELWFDVDAWEHLPRNEAWTRFNTGTTTRIAVCVGQELSRGEWDWNWTAYTTREDDPGSYDVDRGSGWYGPR